MLPRFDSAGVSPLDRSHDDTNEEEHLSLLHAVKHKQMLVKIRSVFPVTDSVHNFISSFNLIPSKLEALVSQKTQCELQTREQEEVAEIN